MRFKVISFNVCRVQRLSFCPGAGTRFPLPLEDVGNGCTHTVFMARTVRESAQTVVLCTRCCTISRLMQLDPEARWQTSLRRWQLDWIGHCWQTWHKGGSKGHPISEDAGRWVSTCGRAFSCGDCYHLCVCVREAAPVSIFMRLWQGGRGGKRQKPRELAVKVSKYTKRRRVPRRDGTLCFCGGEKRQRGNRTWCNGSVSPLSMFWLTYWMQEIRNRPQMSASLNLTS